MKNSLIARFEAGISSKLSHRKLTRILILIFVTILLPITSVSEKADAAGYYPFGGSSYSRYSLGSFSVTVTITFRKKSTCSGWNATNLVATPGPLGTKAVFLSWDHPRCGRPSGGYQISLIERGGYDAGTASQANGSFSYSSGKMKYLKVPSKENKVMIEGFDSSKVVELQILALGVWGQTLSPVVISNTARTSSSAVSPTTVTVNEVTPNFSSYAGTSGLRVNWARSLGDVNYYVLQFTDNLNQDLAHTELTAQNTTTEMYIENYVNSRYKVRIKTFGTDGSIAFSDYFYVWTKYAPTTSAGSTGNPTNKSEPVPVLPALTPIVKQISSNLIAKTVTLFVTNFQPGYTWVFSTNGTIKAEIDSKGYITLSGINSCGFSGVFMAVNRTGYLTGTANPEYEMKCIKLTAPTFSNIKSSSSGFTVQITNYDPSLKYFMSQWNSNATLSMDASGLITATGVSSSSFDTVISVSVTKEGFYSNQSEVRGFAVDVVYEPILGEIYRTSEGIGFKISNFDPQLTWYTVIANELPGRANLDRSSGIVTVTPLRSGEIVQLELAASKSGKLVVRRYIPLTGPAVSVQPALTPTFSVATSQATGFTSQVSNYNSAYTWGVSTSAGTATINSTGLITVSGLAAGQSATVTTRTDRTGYSSGSSTVSGQATAAPNQPALVPGFNTPTKAAGSFYVSITNYSSSYQWSATTTAGTVVINSSGQVTVSGLAQGQAATVTVRSSRTGYNSGTSNFSSAAIVTSLTPNFGALSSAINGFWIVITNYDPTFTWKITSSSGSAFVYENGNLGVSNIGRNTSVSVTVTATKNGISSSASTVGKSN